MKSLQIIHNPTAGDEEHTKEDLLAGFQDNYEVTYFSTQDDNWESFSKNLGDLILLAGGDGTVHKVTEILSQITTSKIPPIYLFPMGTANNIAKTLKIPFVQSLKSINFEKKFSPFDHGKVKGFEEEEFFIESVGFGIFPQLMQHMKTQPIEEEPADEKLKRTIKELLHITTEFKAEKARIKANGFEIKGKFLLVEVMNITYLGPNLKLSPGAHPGDGFFELVLIPEEGRGDLIKYVKSLKKNKPRNIKSLNCAQTLKLSRVKLQWKGKLGHVDDKLIDNNPGQTISIKNIHDKFSLYARE